MKRDEFSDLIVFQAVATAESFTRAAARLETSQSAVSHAIRRLEQRLGIRLLTRTTRNVALTQAGQTLLASLDPALGAVEAALEALDAQKSTPTGTLRIATSTSAAHQLLTPVLPDLLRSYPRLQIEVVTESRIVNIIEEGFDAAIRLGEHLEKDMVAIRVSPDMRMSVCGSPDYFARTPAPQTPHDLTEHNCLNLRLTTLGGLYPWEFEQNGKPLNVRVSGQFTSTNPDLLQAMAVAGIGLVSLPTKNVAADLVAGRLVSVLEDWFEPFSGYYLSYPSHRENSPAMKVLLDAMLRQRRELDRAAERTIDQT